MIELLGSDLVFGTLAWSLFALLLTAFFVMSN